MKKALLYISLIAVNTTMALAQVQVGQTATQRKIGGGPLLDLLGLAQKIVTLLVPFAIGVAVLVFFYFLITFILKGKDDPTKQQSSLAGMGYSVLALFVMVSIWGIIGFVGSLFGIGQGGSIPAPTVPVP